MTAGRALDALVAEKVMGWKRGERYGNGNGEWIRKEREEFRLTWDQTPYYSTDIAAAWKVVEQMARDGWDYNLEWKGATRNYAFTAEGYFAKWVDGHHMIHHAVADTVPLHICLAALKAMSVEVKP